MASSLKAQLKTLIAAKQYQAAIVLLEASDMPDKKTYIARLQLRMKEARAEVEASPAPVKEKAKPRYSGRGVLGIVVFALVLLGVGVVVMINLTGRDAGRALRLHLRMADVCKSVYEDEYLDGRYTAHQLVFGCGEAAKYSTAEYQEAVDYCFDNQNQTEAIFINCLADNDVKIEEVWILTAPKE